MNIAEKYNLERIVSATNKYMLKNFVDISKTPDFLTISKDALCKYLSDPTLYINNAEINVFRAAKEWIEKDLGERIEFLLDVMKTVRFHMIASDLLTEEISNVPFVEESKDCRGLILKALSYQNKVHAQPLQDTNQFQTRGEIGRPGLPWYCIPGIHSGGNNY